MNLIGSTRTTQGLEVHAWLDERAIPKAAPSTKTSLPHSTSAAMRFKVIGTMRSIPRRYPTNPVVNCWTMPYDRTFQRLVQAMLAMSVDLAAS